MKWLKTTIVSLSASLGENESRANNRIECVWDRVSLALKLNPIVFSFSLIFWLEIDIECAQILSRCQQREIIVNSRRTEQLTPNKWNSERIVPIAMRLNKSGLLHLLFTMRFRINRILIFVRGSVAIKCANADV